MLLAQVSAGNPAAIVATVFGSIGSVVFIVLMFVYENKKRHLAHLEKMKALEMGQPLPDADTARVVAVGFIGTVVPVACMAAGVVATSFVLEHENLEEFKKYLAIIWGISGGVSLAVAMPCISYLRGGREKDGCCK